MLFIDCLPLHCWTDHNHTPPVRHYSVRVSVIPTDAGMEQPPPGVKAQDWIVDIGFTGEAFASRLHLEDAGFDLSKGSAGKARFRSPVTRNAIVTPVREADLWLVSNIPRLASKPFFLSLDRGIAYPDERVERDSHSFRALIGMRALRRARLKMEVDFAESTVSVWTPS